MADFFTLFFKLCERRQAKGRKSRRSRNFLFLIFDVETIFLYPFAVSLNSLGLFAVIEAFIFVAILLFGLYFAINKKMLRWV